MTIGSSKKDREGIIHLDEIHLANSQLQNTNSSAYIYFSEHPEDPFNEMSDAERLIKSDFHQEDYSTKDLEELDNDFENKILSGEAFIPSRNLEDDEDLFLPSEKIPKYIQKSILKEFRAIR